jgi:hypothetical protein
MTILSWMEMTEEDQPPEEIWLNSEAISEHFDHVRQRYRDKSGGGMESVPEAGTEMQDNEFVKSLMK